MADQRDHRNEELTPDQCIDFAAGLLDSEARAEVLRRAAASPVSEELLRTVIAQAETARSAAAARGADPETAGAGERRGNGFGEAVRAFLETLFGSGRLIPAVAGASLLVIGLILGAGSVHLLQPDGAGSGAPARLVSLFPSAARSTGPAAAVAPGTGLYVELNGIEYPCDRVLLFDLVGPSGETLFRGRLLCQPETGEWAGIYLPATLLDRDGDYRLRLRPEDEMETAGTDELEFRFGIR